MLRAVARGEGLQPVVDEIVEAAKRLCHGEQAFSPHRWGIASGGLAGGVKVYDCRLCGNLSDLKTLARGRLAPLRR